MYSVLSRCPNSESVYITAEYGPFTCRVWHAVLLLLLPLAERQRFNALYTKSSSYLMMIQVRPRLEYHDINVRLGGFKYLKLVFAWTYFRFGLKTCLFCKELPAYFTFVFSLCTYTSWLRSFTRKQFLIACFNPLKVNFWKKLRILSPVFNYFHTEFHWNRFSGLIMKA